MRLVVTVKHKIILDLGKSGKPVTIQSTSPNVMYFKLSEVRAFSDSDIKYIISTIPDYKEYKAAIKNYVDKLEGEKAAVLDRMKEKKHRLVDTRPVDCKVVLDTKIEHEIDYESDMDEPYRVSFLEYDYTDGNNLLKN